MTSYHRSIPFLLSTTHYAFMFTFTDLLLAFAKNVILCRRTILIPSGVWVGHTKVDFFTCLKQACLCIYDYDGMVNFCSDEEGV